MKGFPNLPNPCDGEIFSSWLFRCYHSQFTCISDRESLFARPAWTWSGNLIKVADPDFEFDTPFFFKVCEILKIDEYLTSVYFQFRDEGLVGWEHRYWFCPECLRNDVRIGKIPAWRKEWCSSYSVFCRTHSIELVMLNVRPTYSKAWDAYVQICNQEIASSSWSDERFVRLRIAGYSQIKRWLSQKADGGEIDEVEGRLFSRLYCVFLQLPTRRRDSGIARTFFHQERVKKYSDLINYKENLFLCPQISEPRSRFGSMMLLGILLEITSLKYASIFQRYCGVAKVFFPATAGIENIIYLGGLSREDYAYLHEYLGLFPREKWARLDSFFTRQEGRYRQAGVCSGMRLGEPI
ncbi:hypothetical protein ACOI9X_25175 [Pseudomonas sp. P2757]|uniref:hypothetical protein n=1 Tax=unclassified Pseudomonas TaxID=196821 RepID=UPI003B5C4D8E